MPRCSLPILNGISSLNVSSEINRIRHNSGCPQLPEDLVLAIKGLHVILALFSALRIRVLLDIACTINFYYSLFKK